LPASTTEKVPENAGPVVITAASAPTVVPDAVPAAKLVPDKLTSATVCPGVVMVIGAVVNGAMGGVAAASDAVSVIE